MGGIAKKQVTTINKIIQQVYDEGTEAIRITEITDADVPNQTGLNTTLGLTTTAIEGKVGLVALVDRKYIEMQALTNNVRWGYDASCPFTLFKNQFFALPAGPACKFYFKTSSGIGQVVISEK